MRYHDPSGKQYSKDFRCENEAKAGKVDTVLGAKYPSSERVKGHPGQWKPLALEQAPGPIIADMCRVAMGTVQRLSELRAMRAEDTDIEHQMVWVFETNRGTPYRAVTAGSELRKTVTHLGVAVTFHSFRHLFASRLISAGASVEQVQRALGHSSAAGTLDIYAHFFPGDDELSRAPVRVPSPSAGKLVTTRMLAPHVKRPHLGITPQMTTPTRRSPCTARSRGPRCRRAGR